MRKEYGEYEVKITYPKLIFLLILVLGLEVLIFIMGVSVGKKYSSAQEKKLAKEKIEEITKPPVIIKPEPQKEQAKPEEKKPEVKKALPQEKLKPELLYFIQIGAFSTKASADKLASEYSKKGFKVAILDPLKEEKNPVFRVRIGSYQSKEEAEKVKNELEKQNKAKYILLWEKVKE
ncbi:MAG: SPOR domain-containing protein [Acidobacteriota bacterium]